MTGISIIGRRLPAPAPICNTSSPPSSTTTALRDGSTKLASRSKASRLPVRVKPTVRSEARSDAPASITGASLTASTVTVTSPVSEPPRPSLTV